MNRAPSQIDPWSTGTPAYRACLLAGIGLTFLGILAVIGAALLEGESLTPGLRTAALILIGGGLVSHVIGILLRKRQAGQIIRDRKDQENPQ